MLDFEKITIDPKGVKMKDFLPISSDEELFRDQVLVRVQNSSEMLTPGQDMASVLQQFLEQHS